MKLKLFALLFIALVPGFIFAQGSILTIFSEDGGKFTLFLNGQQQNVAPQSTLCIDGITQPVDNARIVFEDKSRPAIYQKISVSDPASGAPANVIYQVGGKAAGNSLTLVSSQPVLPNYVPPANSYLIHYGQPDNGNSATPVTLPPNNQNGGISITPVPAGGNSRDGAMEMDYNVPDPGGRATITPVPAPSASAPVANNCKEPMRLSDFKSALETIKNAAYEDAKFATAKGLLSSNCLSSEQVSLVCRQFGFEKTKLDFAKCAYPHTTDPGNFIKLTNVFGSQASKTDLSKFISNGGR